MAGRKSAAQSVAVDVTTDRKQHEERPSVRQPVNRFVGLSASTRMAVCLCVCVSKSFCSVGMRGVTHQDLVPTRQVR